MKRSRKLATVIGSAVLAATAINLQAPTVDAADHLDGSVGADAAADIGDFYAWNDGAGNIVAVLTFNGLLEVGDEAVYDDEVLYTIHIDNTADPAEAVDFLGNDNDNEADLQIHARFGMNGNGEWGMQVLDLPGADAELVGAVGEDLGAAGARATVGLFDDPFFFDLGGFLDTVDNVNEVMDDADLAFASLDPMGDGPVDGLEDLNTMALVFEFAGTEVVGDNANNFLQMWATTGRVPR